MWAWLAAHEDVQIAVCMIPFSVWQLISCLRSGRVGFGRSISGVIWAEKTRNPMGYWAGVSFWAALVVGPFFKICHALGLIP
jgi:hypothetical protein